MLWDKVKDWFMINRSSLGAICAFFAGGLKILSDDFPRIESLLAFMAANFIVAGQSNSDQYHKRKQDFEKATGQDDRRER